MGQLATECTNDPEPSLQAIGWNLLADHRVSEERAEHFFVVTGEPSTVANLKRALDDYHRDWVCRRPDETYLSQSRNGRNFVRKSSLPKGTELANALNVSGWVYRLRTKDPRIGIKLESRLKDLAGPSPPADAVEAFLMELFAAINSRRDGRPMWAARWKELVKSIDDGSCRTWNEAVGAWRRRDSWQVVLRYPLAAVPTLVRPTQLDSGYYEYHFPSPPFPRPTRGGFTMALRELAVGAALVSEWIHPPIDLHIDHWIAGGRLWGVIEDETSDSLWFCRSQHRARLLRRFGRECGGWLPPR